MHGNISTYTTIFFFRFAGSNWSNVRPRTTWMCASCSSVCWCSPGGWTDRKTSWRVHWSAGPARTWATPNRRDACRRTRRPPLPVHPAVALPVTATMNISSSRSSKIGRNRAAGAWSDGAAARRNSRSATRPAAAARVAWTTATSTERDGFDTWNKRKIFPKITSYNGYWT